MPLSDHEERVFGALARQIVSEDPDLAHDLGAGRSRMRRVTSLVGFLLGIGLLTLFV
jgi:hypothetical protein